jgi:hypothetical protein
MFVPFYTQAQDVTTSFPHIDIDHAEMKLSSENLMLARLPK